MSHEKAAPLTEVSAMDPALAALLMELWAEANLAFGEPSAQALISGRVMGVLRGLNEGHAAALVGWQQGKLDARGRE